MMSMPKKKRNNQQKVDLTERSAQGGGAQRRESAQSETGFGTDQLFDDDPQATPQGAATPNSEHRRPTIKSMKHKVAKTFKRGKGSSSSTPEAQPPPEDTSGARGSNSGTEHIPTLSSSPVMTHKANPQSPISSDGLWTDLSEIPTPLADNLLPLDDTTRLQEEEDKTAGSREFTPTKEPAQPSGLERAAQTSRESGAKEKGKQLSQNAKLKYQVKDLKEKLKAKEDESKKLKTKLDQSDIDHQNHLDMKVEKLTEAHQTEMKTKEASFNERAQQWKEERGTFEREQFVQENERYKMSLKRTEGEITKLRETLQEEERSIVEKASELETANQTIDELKQNREAQLATHKQEIKRKDVEIRKAEVQVKRLQEQNDKLKAKEEELPQQKIDVITQELTNNWKAIIQSLEDDHKKKIQHIEEAHADKIATLTREHQEEIKKARSDRQEQKEELEKEIRDEYEQRHEEDIQKAKTEESDRWQALNQQHKEKYENQIRDNHKKALAEKTQKHKEEVADLHEQARKLELKYLKNGDDFTAEVIEHDSSPEQVRREEEMDQHHQATIADSDLENGHLKTELAAQKDIVRDLQHELDHRKEQYEIQAMAKQHLSLNLSPTDSEGDDNRTDAEKLRCELEKLTRKAEQDAVTHRQEAEDLQREAIDLQAQVEELTQRLNEITTSNVELQEVIKITIEQAPPSADGIQAGDEGDSTKLLQHIRGKFLEKVTEIVDLKQKHVTEKDELKQRFGRKMNELTEKILEKDRQLKAQRDSRSRAGLPPTSSVDDDADEDEESTSIAKLKATLRTKDKEIQSLAIQLQTFQQVASQRQQLQEHSKTQSTIVVKLRKDLEAAQEELRVMRDMSEVGRRVAKCEQTIIQRNEELRDLKKAKTEVEDELDILKRECEAEKKTHDSVKRDLAKSQSVVSSFKDRSTRQEGAEEDPQEIQILQAEVNLSKIEAIEYENKVERLNNRITELGKANLSLERRLRESNEERDVSALQNIELRASKHIYKGQLDKSRKNKVDVTQEHLTLLANTIVSKTEENDLIQQKVKELKEELELATFQAFQYKEDFKEERAAREQAAGTKDGLSNQLRESKEEAETEKREKQAVIAKLETTVTEKHQLAKQMTQTEEDFDRTLATKWQEIERIRAEKVQLMAQMEHFRTESSKFQRQLQTAEATYKRREAELVQEMDELNDEAAKTQDKVQIAAAMNISLNEQLESVTQHRDSKQEKLEILANEKSLVDDQLTHERNHTAALAQNLVAKEQELSHTKQTGNRIAEELQDARQVSLADAAKLHDEIMAKTAQVKQYKKQTDSFKAKVEEANIKLLKTQQELQRCQELINTMEEDNQYQIERAKVTADSDKLVAETNLIQFRRRVEALEKELLEFRNGGELPEAMRVEVDRRMEMEQKLLAAEEKCNELMDKCDTRYQAIEKLKKALAQHSIAIPVFSIDKVEIIPHQASNSRQPASPVMRESQFGQQQRGGYPRDRAGYEQQQAPSVPAVDANRRFTEPQNSISSHGHVRTVPPRVQEDGDQYWENPQAREGHHQLPSTSQAQLPAQNRMDTGPPIRASDPGTQHNIDPRYQGGQQNQQRINDPHQPMYASNQYQQGGQQNQPNQRQGEYHPNQRGGYDPNQQGVDPRQNQQLQQGYAQGGPSFNHHGQQHPPPRSPNYQPQAHNYPPTSYAQGSPSPYHQYGVDQIQRPPPGAIPQSQAPFTPPNAVQPQQMVSNQASPPRTGRGQLAQLAPEVQPTPLPRRNSKENLPNSQRPKQNSNVQENILLQGIGRDIEDAAKFVFHEGDELESMAPDAPFDPNLICPLCMRNFRVGEIQKYKKHVNTCQGQ